MKDFRDDIKTWFSKQPLWLQHTAQRLIENSAITEEEIEELLLLCKKEAGIDIDIELDPIPVEIPKGGSPSKASGTSMRLLSIIDLKVINALAPRNPLQFGDVALAVIYGANGSGKSGYIRALKHASGARNPGPLHRNVFDTVISEQSCTFEIDLGSRIKKITWSPSDGVINELCSISMYDAVCGYIYVNEENEVTYEPGILSLFSILTEVCGKVSQMLKEEIERTESRNPFLPRELELTEMGGWYNKLIYSTDIAEVDKKCRWTEEHESELTELKKRLFETTPDERIKTLKESNDNLMTLMSQLKTFRNRLSDENCTTYLSAKEDLRLKKRAAEEDAKKIFSDVPLEGVGSESWKLLWEQARKYSEEIAYRGIPFPNIADGARCVLCQHPLDAKSKKRFQSFEQFVKGGLQKEVIAAEEHLSILSDALEEIPVEDHLTLAQIEEPIEKELKAIKRQSESWKKSGRQQTLFAELRTAFQGELPMEMESFEEWQATILDRLRSHFDSEAKSADRVQAFFGREAAQGIALFNLLARRYDVVATNPPYMGSKNMGHELKRYVENRYRPGKRDLYATFILRCLEMTAPSGKLAMVTQQSWMFLRSFVEMRAIDEDKLKDLGTGAFKGLLRDTTIETLAHLGEHAFDDPAAAGAFVALFTLAKTVLSEQHRLTAFRLIGPKSPQEKDRLLRESIKAGD